MDSYSFPLLKLLEAKAMDSLLFPTRCTVLHHHTSMSLPISNWKNVSSLEVSELVKLCTVPVRSNFIATGVKTEPLYMNSVHCLCIAGLSRIGLSNAIQSILTWQLLYHERDLYGA